MHAKTHLQELDYAAHHVCAKQWQVGDDLQILLESLYTTQGCCNREEGPIFYCKLFGCLLVLDRAVLLIVL